MTPNKQSQIIYYRSILLDEDKQNEERVNAQKKLMELLEISESDNNTKKEVK